MKEAAPILYEINTRVWLRELSEQLGRTVTLSEIPESEIQKWKKLGFTHIWLMGIWQIGPQARQIALEYWRSEWGAEGREQDVIGSPFAIQQYSVDERLGPPLDLLMLKERLGKAGLKLILDFVPNHLGIDSPEPNRYPARFVQASAPAPGTFSRQTAYGLRYFAYGRDPYFAPWADTVQVDYRVAEAQESMSTIAQTISMFGDGLRCDMAMLLLPDIFNSTWKDFPSVGNHLTDANFWRTAIPKIRLLQPQVELIAEAYWDRETDLQEAGFDYTYNKRVTDFLVQGQDAPLVQRLRECAPNFLRHSVHFLENHDEKRAAAIFPFRRHQAAAALILFLPGMAFLHDGQLEGREQFARIQMSRRPEERANPEVARFYREILAVLPETHVRRGRSEMVFFNEADAVVGIRWRAENGEADLALVNLGKSAAKLTLGSVSAMYSTTGMVEIGDGSAVIPPESALILREKPGAKRAVTGE